MIKRRKFLAALPALAAASCARMEDRAPRYDETECPFCVPKPGTCFYCGGTTKCTFCNGTGKRETGTPTISTGQEVIEEASYVEDCPYCEGTGTCRYCRGTGTCWACDGTGRVTSWDFYEKYQKLTGGKNAPPAPPAPKPAPQVDTAAQDSMPAADQ